MIIHNKARADDIFCVRSLSVKNIDKLGKYDGLSVAVAQNVSNAVFSINATFLLIKKRAAEKITGVKICSTASAVLCIKALYSLGVRGVGLFLGKRGWLFSYGLTVSEFTASTLPFSFVVNSFISFVKNGEDCFSAFSKAFIGKESVNA